MPDTLTPASCAAIRERDAKGNLGTIRSVTAAPRSPTSTR